MKVLFCHDGPLIKDSEENYYGISFNDEMFKRYYTIADEIIVLTRQKIIDKDKLQNKISKITITPIKFIEVPNLSNPVDFIFNDAAKEIILEAVKSSDYVVARLHSVIGMLAYDYARKFNIPCLTEVVGCPWDAYWNHSLKGKIAAPFMYFQTKKRVKSSSHVVYVTSEFLQKRYPTNGKNTNCSNVSLIEFEKNTLRNRLKNIEDIINRDKIIIGTTAAIDVKYKGQQYVIQALGDLKKKGISNFEYQLVGNGNSSYLKSVAEKNDVVNQVKFVGTMTHDQVFNWLDTIDIYVQPSRQEGLPRAVIEAMSRGLPAIGAKTAGIPELLEDKYIFSNTRKNISEISTILLSMDVEKMKSQAIRNYNESKKYNREDIEKRRNNFFKEFKKMN
ncbi:glycosyltransferase [Aerococcus urinaeequi]|uniref:glycosyltransferase n=1 Tax=Aerococcus urinaeequi TaxID=51665 RepID=UPI003B3A85C6